ncbi:MAG: hypothetical protein VKL42_08810 [Snowella sp.]|nr:hypothetical protein [Snowella sp.]
MCQFNDENMVICHHPDGTKTIMTVEDFERDWKTMSLEEATAQSSDEDWERFLSTHL